MSSASPEKHFADRIGWLRAAVLGANDGIISIASLVLGVAASGAAHAQVMVAGVAGLVAGAMSMACGEYVSVSSQADTEKADLAREQRELDEDEGFEREELALIYQERGLDSTLAREVARQLMEHDALGAHARDELGLTDTHTARPLQAALTSGATFAVGAAMPLLVALLAAGPGTIPAVAASTLVFLAITGILAAQAGGSSRLVGAVRVTFWGVLAMAVTSGIGYLFGAKV